MPRASSGRPCHQQRHWQLADESLQMRQSPLQPLRYMISFNYRGEQILKSIRLWASLEA